MHGSFTKVGDKLDNYMIGIVAYLGYQISMKNIPNKSNMLEGLQWDPRSKNVTMVIKNLSTTIRDDPVPEWERILDHEDYPVEYYASFAAIVVNLAAFSLGTSVTGPLINFLANVLLRNLHNERIWLLNNYLPELLQAMKKIKPLPI